MTTDTHPEFCRLAGLLAGDRPIALLENNLDHDGRARVFSDLERQITAWDAGSIPGAIAEIEAASARGSWVTIAADFELGYALESSLLNRQPQTGRPLLTAMVWAQMDEFSRTQADALIALSLEGLKADARIAGLVDLKFGLSQAEYVDAVSRIRQLIAAGDCYQVNFTFPLAARAYGDPLALYARLRTAQPVRYGGFVRHCTGAILSHSPELFVARRGAQLTARPMKGTAPLGEAAALANSTKDRAENLMIVDLIRNDLGRLAATGGVRVERLFEIEDYATLHQMTSTIVAEPVRASLAETLHALYPCGSVTGAPKIRAMEVIREIEPTPRGIYCGALGWLAPNGDFSLNVPIRTLELNASGTARLGIGSGIVADSEPADEWAECAAKARFVTALTPRFELFETLCLASGETTPRLLDLHLARLTRSAAALGFAFNEAEARALIARTSAPLHGKGAHRLRLALAPGGALSLSHASLDPLAGQLTVILSPERLDSRDPLLQHKTSRRFLYDQTLKECMARGHFDALFFNERDELCEGARSNVFIEVDGRLLTPPARSGLLPGVMRQALLDAGKAHEAVLRRADLLSAQAVYVSNALRGLIAVTVAN
ncbi:aminodeoxychorismate synthase component I [Niveibacterium sp. 24ML]|uniref:aminodeoxychorismate synthase component I n=1 Tax=Niveibacterium sp. 24ML TaxID=2985512 RepID=UPI00226F5D46|nr:aminodeoxychorismate synthase component I [Niveibacterium sp. 24ML]MCX9155267.1 aminodeoxychorismate synthase component I [Niveibacterium sp. 24ML]